MTARRAHGGLSGEGVKTCCAEAYGGEWARLLLGASFHPGGPTLTRRLGTLMGLGPGSAVLDVACGRGGSALELAHEFGCRVTGIDLSPANIEDARIEAREAEVEQLLAFQVGDAEALPVDSASVNAVICECAFCTFPDKATAARELARVLKPGGVLGLADLTREGDLEPELDSLLGWVACVADAQPVESYVAYLEQSGLTVDYREAHDAALRDLVSQIRMKLLAAEVAVGLGKLSVSLDDIRTGRRLSRMALAAVADGTLGYTLLIARAPGPDDHR